MDLEVKPLSLLIYIVCCGLAIYHSTLHIVCLADGYCVVWLQALVFHFGFKNKLAMGKTSLRTAILRDYRCLRKRVIVRSVTSRHTGMQPLFRDLDNNRGLRAHNDCPPIVGTSCHGVPVASGISEKDQTNDAAGFLNTRLRKGFALGNIVFKSAIGVQFKCTKDCIGGRGLRIYQSMAKGVTIARGEGRLVHFDDPDFNAVCMSKDYKLYDSQYSILQLFAPTVQSPANLANTSCGGQHNNCRIRHKIGSNFFSIETIRALRPGEEVTVAYGSKFTKYVRAEATLAAQQAVLAKKQRTCSFQNGLVQCDKCNLLLGKHRLKSHRGRIGCVKRQLACDLS